MKISKWRNAGKRVEIWGIPVMMFALYLFWFQRPEWSTLYAVTALIAFFKILSLYGLTLTVLWQRLLTLLRGQWMTGQPWWYRKYFE